MARAQANAGREKMRRVYARHRSTCALQQGRQLPGAGGQDVRAYARSVEVCQQRAQADLRSADVGVRHKARHT